MAVNQQPKYDVVKRAGHLLHNPKDATDEDVVAMAARILDDERNSPSKNKTDPKPTKPPTTAKDIISKASKLLKDK